MHQYATQMKQRITITVDREILDWIDGRVAEYLFANRSHSFEYLVSKRKKEDKDEGTHNDYSGR